MFNTAKKGKENVTSPETSLERAIKKPLERAHKTPLEKARKTPLKTALVTGASSGIGEAVSKVLGMKGILVILVARRKDKLDAIASQIKDAGGRAHVIEADLTSADDRKMVYDEVISKFSGLDILVNNAGFGWYGYGSDMEWKIADDMIRLNVGAVVHFTLMFLPVMIKNKHGHIINIGSIAGSIPSQGVALYSASKSFIDSFTSAIYRELKGTGVHIGILKPGPVLTEFFDSSMKKRGSGRIPAERFGVQVSVVADKVWEMVGRPRKRIYVPWVLRFVPLVELTFGRIIDLLGPALLKRNN